MIIQKMNVVLVKHSKVLFGIFTAVIIVSFVWFFTPGVDGSLFFGRSTGDKSQYGLFFDQPVTYGEVRAAMRQLSLMYGGVEIPEEQAFLFAVRKKAADKMGANVSDKELSDMIRTLPMFQKDGKFSVEEYENFVRKHLEPMGYAVTDYEDAVREVVRAEKVNEIVCANVTLSDSEYESMMNEKMEKFSFRFVQFIPGTLTGEVKVEQEKLKAFFEANKENLLPPPTFSGAVVMAMNANYKAVIAPEKVKAYYDANQDEFKDKDGKVKAFDVVKAEIEKKLAAADTTGADNAIKAFRAKLQEARKGEEYAANPEAAFRALAKEAGLPVQDVKDVTEETIADVKTLEVDPLFALSSLKNAGSVTNVVKGEKGSYIVMLTKRDVKTDTTFEEAAERTEILFRVEKAKELVPVFAKNFRDDMAKAKDPAKELEALAKKHHANVMAFPADVSRFMLESNPNTAMLRGILFDTEAGKLSVSRAQNGVEVMIFMDKRTPATPEELAPFKSNPQIRDMFLQEKKMLVLQEYEHWIQTNAGITVPRRTDGAN